LADYTISMFGFDFRQGQGGEGFNLHRKCSFLINYDLPWNPARLVQRIGRLYRYGQTRRVKVLNLQARDTIDNEIRDAALQRVNTIVNEMAPTSAEFADGDGYRTEILGELLEQLDLSDILGDESAFGAWRAQCTRRNYEPTRLGKYELSDAA